MGALISILGKSRPRAAKRLPPFRSLYRSACTLARNYLSAASFEGMIGGCKSELKGTEHHKWCTGLRMYFSDYWSQWHRNSYATCTERL